MQMLSPEAAKALVGTDLGASDWYLIDQEMVNRFADLTNDHQFIHVNPEAAKMPPFGGTIVHGFFTLSMLAGLQPEGAIVLEGIKMGVNYGCDRIRFLEPVPVGSRIRARHKLKAVDDKGGGRWLLTSEVTIEIEGKDKPALIADWLGMQFVG
jgi:acyl dehydratase